MSHLHKVFGELKAGRANLESQYVLLLRQGENADPSTLASIITQLGLNQADVEADIQTLRDYDRYQAAIAKLPEFQANYAVAHKALTEFDEATRAYLAQRRIDRMPYEGATGTANGHLTEARNEFPARIGQMKKEHISARLMKYAGL